MYMSLLGKPTDADLNTFSHVLLTGPYKWDPSVLYYTLPTTAGDTPTVPQLVTPPGPQIPPNMVYMTQD